MPIASYEPLSQEQDYDLDEILSPPDFLQNDRRSSPIPIRPEVYYGDGPFDAPSSDEDDETLLEKDGPSTPGTVERGSLPLGHNILERKVSLFTCYVVS
jgi:dipeptidyl aminopeptidase